MVTGLGVMLANPAEGDSTPRTTLTAATATTPAATPTAADSFATLAALPPDELDDIDLARMNLLTAEGLPGAEGKWKE